MQPAKPFYTSRESFLEMIVSYTSHQKCLQFAKILRQTCLQTVRLKAVLKCYSQWRHNGVTVKHCTWNNKIQYKLYSDENLLDHMIDFLPE